MSDGASTSGPREGLVAALVKELTEARRRGLDRLDLDTGQWKVPGRIPTPELERLAREHFNDYESSRIALIHELMTAALADWQRRKYVAQATFVRDLFFAEDGRAPGGRNPTDLADGVRTHWNITGKQFDERREANFTLFARFLIGFVATEGEPIVEVPAADPAVLEDQALEEEPPGPSGGGPRRRPRWLPWAIAGVVAAVIVVLVIVFVVLPGHHTPPRANGAGGTTSGGARPAATTSSGGCAARKPAPASSGPVITFDALCGGSNYIRVFPGVQDVPADKVQNGTYQDGQTASAVCKTKGRTVSSDPSVGELPRTSDDWVQVVAQPGAKSYATLTYGEMDPTVLAQLPPCSSVP